MKIYLDPGHGGANPGCTAENLHEKIYTLSFALELGSALVDDGHTVRYSRLVDENPPFTQRAWRANGLDVALVIHVNANPSPDAHGLRCYVMPANPQSTASYKLAQQILAAAPTELKPKLGRRVPDIATLDGYGDDVVIRHYTTPACILVELGFATNPDDRAYLLSDAGRSAIVAAMVGVFHGRV